MHPDIWEVGVAGRGFFLEPRTGAPRGRPPVPEAAAETAAKAAVISASSGSGWWTELETGHPAAGD